MPPTRNPTPSQLVARTAAPRSSPVVRGAALAAAGALGVLVGLGLRGVGSDGPETALARLAVVSMRLRGVPEFVAPDRHAGAAALAGGLHAAAVAAAWGVVIGAAAERHATRRTRRVPAAALLVGIVIALAAADRLLPTALQLAAGTLTSAEWVLMVVVVALAASAGAGQEDRAAAVGAPTVGAPTVGAPTVGAPTVGAPTVSAPVVGAPLESADADGVRGDHAVGS